ncbi:MAG: hypothetical protein ACXU8A_14365 [Burkholderiaceae bacterium]|jgi:uncharacterized protein YeeX (DUF496 family)
MPENVNDYKLRELTMLSIGPIVRNIRHWWLQRAEDHYLICADVEEERAREAQQNASYYQKQAAIARSERLYQ